MKSLYFWVFLLVISIFISESTYLSIIPDYFLYIDTSFGFTRSPERIVNFLSNSYSLSVLDPVSMFFQQNFSAVSTLVFICAIFGVTFLGQKLNTFLSSILFIFSFLFTFGIDSFILPVLAYFSLSIFLFEKGTRISILLGCLAFIFVCLKVPAFSILFYIILIAAVSSQYLSKSKFPLSLFAIGINFTEEPLRLDSYPEFSRVLKESAPFVDSWVGEKLPFAIASEKLFFSLSTFSISALLILTLLSLRNISSQKLKVSAVILGVLAWEILIEGSSLSLYESLKRLIPHGTVYPVGGFLFSCALYFFFLEAKSVHKIIYSCCFALSLIFTKNLVLLSPFPHFNNLKENLHLLDNSEIITSPSLRIFLDEGPSVLNAPLKDSLRSRSLDRFPFHIQASTHSEYLDRINTPELSKRWASLAGKQQGNEWIQISFDEPQTIKGLTVFPGEFQTDYPRGLVIQSGNNCESLSDVYVSVPYEGSILRSKDGFPFRTTPNLGEVLFNYPVQTSCIKILQVGESLDYDWSVSAIRILQ